MSAIGSLQVRATTSNAKLPLEDVAVTVVDDNGRLLGLRLTDSSGLTTPIRLEVPDSANTQSPDTGKAGFAKVNLYARGQGYEQILVREVQVFPGIVTMQELNLVPLSELPGAFDASQIIDTPPQNL